jgi:hypothetical protein
MNCFVFCFVVSAYDIDRLMRRIEDQIVFNYRLNYIKNLPKQFVNCPNRANLVRNCNSWLYDYIKT